MSDDIILSIIIILLFATIGYVYKLSVDIEFLKKDLYGLKYPANKTESR